MVATWRVVHTDLSSLYTITLYNLLAHVPTYLPTYLFSPLFAFHFQAKRPTFKVITPNRNFILASESTSEFCIVVLALSSVLCSCFLFNIDPINVKRENFAKLGVLFLVICALC